MSVLDVTEADFEREVIDRSAELPVVVDFWAEWCAPCRQLGPLLESAATARNGQVALAKLDTDASPLIAQAFQIRGIPAVKAVAKRQGGAGVVGPQPPPPVGGCLASLLPAGQAP